MEIAKFSSRSRFLPVCFLVSRPKMTRTTSDSMANNHNILYSKFYDGYQKTSYHTSKRMCNHCSCILDNFSISIFDSQGCRKQFCQTRIHTG